jgi:hypothetical protein
MNAQTAEIDIVGNKANVSEVIRCEQLIKRYPDGNILAVNRLHLSIQAANRGGARC